MKIFKSLDLFGAYYYPNLGKASKQQKTIIGGLSTLVIYSMSLAYFIYQIILWQQGSIQPTIITSKKNLHKLEVHKRYQGNIDFFTGDLPKDPFDIQENILIPVLVYFEGTKASGMTPLLDKIQKYDNQNEFTSFLQVETSLRSGSISESQLLAVIMLIKCQQQFLSMEGSCASQKVIDEYLSQPFLRLRVQIYLERYNSQNKAIENFYKESYLLHDSSFSYYTQISLQSTSVKINDGILFYTQEQKEMIDNAEIVSQSITQEFVQRSFQNLPIVSTFLFKIDTISQEMIVSYPRIGEILAEVGSIISILLSFKIIIVEINEKLLENKLIDKILEFYFPDLKEFQIQRNCLQQIKQVKDPQGEQCDIKQFNKYYEKLRTKAKKKLSILNQMHEIKQIKMILLTIATPQQLKKAKKCKLKFQLIPSKTIKITKNKVVNETILQNQLQKIEQLDQIDQQHQSLDAIPIQKMNSNDYEANQQFFIGDYYSDDNLSLLDIEQEGNKK